MRKKKLLESWAGRDVQFDPSVLLQMGPEEKFPPATSAKMV